MSSDSAIVAPESAQPRRSWRKPLIGLCSSALVIFASAFLLADSPADSVRTYYRGIERKDWEAAYGAVNSVHRRIMKMRDTKGSLRAPLKALDIVADIPLSEFGIVRRALLVRLTYQDGLIDEFEHGFVREGLSWKLYVDRIAPSNEVLKRLNAARRPETDADLQELEGSGASRLLWASRIKQYNREHFLEELQKHPKAARRLIPEIIECLTPPANQTWGRAPKLALKLLGLLGADARAAAFEQVARIALSTSPSDDQSLALQTLARLGPLASPHREQFLKGLESADATTRQTTLRYCPLVMGKPEEALSLLEKQLERLRTAPSGGAASTDQGREAWAIISGLGNVGPAARPLTPAIKELAKKFGADSNQYFKKDVDQALAAIGR